MATVERGVHHCVGVAGAVTERIFRFLQGRCTAGGGTMSSAELEAARIHFLENLPAGMAFFTSANQLCMDASLGSAHAPFDRERILATLLLACSQKAARSAFPHQIERFGDAWLAQFYNGLAEYLKATCANDADARLMKLYFKFAVSRGAKLESAEMLNNEPIRQVLRELVAPLMAADAVETHTISLSDAASRSIATARGIPSPDISKVTDQEVRNFLTWAPPQLSLGLASPLPADACAC